jgi:hypothetical protein
MSLLTNLQAAFTFENGANLGLDSSSNANNLTNNNAATQVTGNAAPGTKAVRFTAASSQSLSIASNASLQLAGTSWELTTWFNLASDPGGGFFPGLVSKWGGAGLEYNLFWDGGNQRVSGRASADGSVQSECYSQALVTNTWYFLDMWFDLPNTTLHLNVNNAASTGVPTASLTGTHAAANAFILGSTAFGSPFLDGIVDSVNLWKRLLTSGERASLYNAGAGLEYPGFADGRRRLAPTFF